MMVEIGQIALVIALLAAGYGTLASFLGATLRMKEMAASGRYALYSMPVLLMVALLAIPVALAVLLVAAIRDRIIHKKKENFLEVDN